MFQPQLKPVRLWADSRSEVSVKAHSRQPDCRERSTRLYRCLLCRHVSLVSTAKPQNTVSPGQIPSFGLRAYPVVDSRERDSLFPAGKLEVRPSISVKIFSLRYFEVSFPFVAIKSSVPVIRRSYRLSSWKLIRLQIPTYWPRDPFPETNFVTTTSFPRVLSPIYDYPEFLSTPWPELNQRYSLFTKTNQ